MMNLQMFGFERDHYICTMGVAYSLGKICRPMLFWAFFFCEFSARLGDISNRAHEYLNLLQNNLPSHIWKLLLQWGLLDHKKKSKNEKGRQMFDEWMQSAVKSIFNPLLSPIYGLCFTTNVWYMLQCDHFTMDVPGLRYVFDFHCGGPNFRMYTSHLQTDSL